MLQESLQIMVPSQQDANYIPLPQNEGLIYFTTFWKTIANFVQCPIKLEGEKNLENPTIYNRLAFNFSLSLMIYLSHPFWP